MLFIAFRIKSQGLAIVVFCYGVRNIGSCKLKHVCWAKNFNMQQLLSLGHPYAPFGMDFVNLY